MPHRTTPSRCQINGCHRPAVRGYSMNLCVPHRQIVVDDIMGTHKGVGLQRCHWPGCRAYPTAAIRLCSTHLTIAAYHAAMDDSIVRQVKRMTGTSLFVPPTPKPKQTAVDGTVYFLRTGGFVKIGWTSDLEKRMKGYPPDSALLAVMPGTRKDENRIHKRFAHLRTHGREWFPLAPQITEYVATIVKDHGEPPVMDFSAKATQRTVGPRLNRYVGGEYRGPGNRYAS